MRFSNGIAVALLFVTGFAFARVAQYRPWLTGFAMVVIGSIVVSATIALGG
jgi:lipoprotein signal peptidase